MDDRLNLAVARSLFILALLLVGGSLGLEACGKHPSDFVTHTAAIVVGAIIGAFNARISGRTGAGQQEKGN